MIARCSGCAFVVLAFSLLGSAVDAEELGFPKRSVELQKGPSEGSLGYIYSSRDSVLFRLELGSRSGTSGDSRSFVAWNAETGKLLARRPAPEGPLPHHWQFSPDGRFLAVPMFSLTRIVQLWEVGSKDPQGVPRLRLITELRPKEPRPKGQPDANSRWRPNVDVAWTPDSKTLIVRHNIHDGPVPAQILFWSFTDKASVWPDPQEDDRGARAWKPWAKLEFETHVDFAVSPDNRTLAVTEYYSRTSNGHLFDLQSAQPLEKFPLERNRDPKSGSTVNYQIVFSPDSKTLAISGFRYFALWDVAPPTPRVEMLDADFHEMWGNLHKMDFTSDSRWLLTLNRYRTDRKLGRAAVVQVRDAQTAEVRHEVTFPEQLGLLHSLTDLPEHRVLLRFESKKGHRQFLWHTDDLLRYAVENGKTPR